MTSPNGDETTIFRGHPSHTTIQLFAGQRQYLRFSVILRPFQGMEPTTFYSAVKQSRRAFKDSAHYYYCAYIFFSSQGGCARNVRNSQHVGHADWFKPLSHLKILEVLWQLIVFFCGKDAYSAFFFKLKRRQSLKNTWLPLVFCLDFISLWYDLLASHSHYLGKNTFHRTSYHDPLLMLIQELIRLIFATPIPSF